ncbi:glutathione S-transferase N-terminal domain-containing protein [Rhizobium terrae]|uniref:glutathione S-transferase N-terminal domain-containing protein n=1 Tax=Rhizobium terrae TaxID=2171756 RepID=UPI000E3EB979|nr:glutathione S-transferase N-terminal domain-containing protein [Rhizobium terrae]
MKLYMHPGACSLSPHIVCRELGLEVETVPVERGTYRLPDGGDYLGINGTGYVPALMLDDGAVLTEGPAIVQFLAASVASGRNLLPAVGSLERSRVQSWLNFITSELHKPMVMLFNAAYAPAHDPIRGLVSRRLDWLNGRIGGPYLEGEGFSVADAYLFVCLNWSPWIGIDLKTWPRLEAFFRAAAGRPAVQAALQAEGLHASPENIFFAPRAGEDHRAAAGVRP